MAKRVKPAKRGRSVSKLPKPAASELNTLLDFVRYAVSRFLAAKLAFAHGTTDPVAEAAFLVCEALHLHPDQFETFATARVTAAERARILDLGLSFKVRGKAGKPRGCSRDYASPEQRVNGDVGTASDVFSLGATLFHALTGAPPHAPQS